MAGIRQEKWRRRAKLREVKSFHIVIGKWSIFIGIGKVETTWKDFFSDLKTRFFGKKIIFFYLFLFGWIFYIGGQSR